MTADDARPVPTDRTETLGRLTGLSDADLPFHGHQRIKTHLMLETTSDTLPARARWRRRQPLFLALGAATCAVTLAITLSVSGSDEHHTSAQPEPAAVRLLDRVAVAAQAVPAPTIRDSQFLYTKTKGHSTALSESEGAE